MSSIGVATLLSEHLPVTRPRRSLFFKHFVTLFVAVVMPLMLGAASEAWFGYRDQRLRINEVLHPVSRSEDERIQDYLDGLRDQPGLADQFARNAPPHDHPRIPAWH